MRPRSRKMLLRASLVFSAFLATSLFDHATAFQLTNHGPSVSSIPTPAVKRSPVFTPKPKPSLDSIEYMTPIPNPTVNKYATQNIKPARNIAVYYESSDQTSVAIVTFKKMQSPVVVLEYIGYINTYQCTGSTLLVTFKDSKSLKYAAAEWQHALSRPLVILSYSASCGQDYPYQRSWLKVSALTVDQKSLTISCAYTAVEITEVVTTVDIKFGPLNQGSSSSTSSSFATVIRSTSTSTSSSLTLISSSISSTTSTASQITSSSSSPSFSTPTGSTTASQSANVSITASYSTTSSFFTIITPNSSSKLLNSTFSSYSSTSSTAPIPTDTVPPLQSMLDFDVALDDSLGYLDPASPTFWSQLMPGVNSSSFSSKKLRRRSFNPGSIASSLINSARNAIANNPGAVGAITSFIENTANNGFVASVADAATALAKSLASYLSSFTLGPFPYNFLPGQQTSTPFGDGVQLVSGSGSVGVASGTLSAYCIGCGVSGSVTIAGQFVIDVQQEALTTAIIDISGPLQAQLAFALIGKVAATDSFQTNVLTFPIPPGLSIFKLITIGPYVSVDVGGSFDFALQGGVELGGTLAWSDIDAKVDLLAETFTPSGYYPTFTPIFDFGDSASLGAKLYSLVTIGAGIKILGGKYAADVGIVGKPEVDLNANQHLYTQYELSQLNDGDVVCGGVTLDVEQIDSAYIEVEYHAGKSNKSTTWGLATATPYTFSTCFGQESTITKTSTSSAASSSAAASSSVPSSSVSPSLSPTPSSSASLSSAPPTTTPPPPQSSCYYLDSDEPDDDGDEDMTCVPLTTDTDTPPPSTPSPTPSISATPSASPSSPPSTTSAAPSSITSSSSLPSSSCDPNLDDFAFISCISSLYSSQRVEEASIFGGAVPVSPVGKRSIIHEDNRWNLVAAPAAKIRQHVPRQTSAPAPAVPSSVGIVSLNGSVFVSWADDGNLVVDADRARSSFQAIGGAVFQDAHSRYLHLYQDAMSTMGVSRLRLASLDAMPTPSVLVVLVPVKLKDGASSYVAATTDGQLFYLLTCLIDEQYPKLFLAKDPVAGATQLQDPSLATTLTGGNVTQCGFVDYGPGT